MTDPDQFQRLLVSVRSVTIASRRLPAQVFSAGYGNYHFLEFDVFSTGFGILLQLLMASSKDQKVGLVMLDPDPEEYFSNNSGSFGAFEIPATLQPDQYRQMFKAGPNLSPFGIFIFTAEVLVCVPPSLRWLLWAERSRDIMILAYENGFDAPPTDALGQSGLNILTIEEALDISAFGWPNCQARAKFARELLNNYSRGQPWVDPIVTRALDTAHKLLAGEIGAIEACRALSPIVSRIGNDLEDLIQTFTEISRETLNLPIGRVRAEWEPSALAVKDTHIARSERIYHTRVVKACRELIERLRAIGH